MSDLKPGFYPDVPYDTYASWDAINHSKLRRMRSTPFHMRYAMLHQGPGTKSMDFGWALHIAVLQPDELEDEILVIPKIDRRSKVGKAAWLAYERKARGRLMVEQKDMDKLKAIRANVLAHPTAREILCGQGQNECSLLWVDRDTGVLCKARTDRLALMRNSGSLMTNADPGSEITLVADLKGMAEVASVRAFERVAYNFGYFEQAAMYVDGVQEVLPGAGERPFVWVVAETEPPHAIHCIQPDELAIDWARGEYKKHLMAYAKCQAEGHWPGWPDGVDTCSVPAWVGKVFEQQL